MTALGTLKRAGGAAVVQDLLTDAWPTMRAAALRAAAAIDPAGLPARAVQHGSGSVSGRRAALAEVLAALPADVAIERLRAMLDDEDKRVVPAVLAALARLKAPDLAAVAAGAAQGRRLRGARRGGAGVGELKPAGGAAALREAYRAAQADAAVDVRAADPDGAGGVRRRRRRPRR